MTILSKIQAELKSPKSQRNDFGKYNYRSMEDINEAVKPLLAAHECHLIISDELINVGDRYYIKATATIYGEGGEIVGQCTGWAREPLAKKGADESQITGACSSYARKYAANGLFALDDTKDADSQKPPEEVSEGQAATISALIEEVGADASKFLGFFKIKKISDLPASRYAEAVKLLEAKR